MQSALPATYQDCDFQRIYESHEEYIRKIIRSFRFAKAEEDDLVQDIFLAAWQTLPSLKDPNAFSGWLRKIARNRCFDTARTLKTEQKRLVYVDNLNVNAVAAEHQTVFGMSLAHFEKHIAVLETLIREHRDPARRKVATLFYLEHRSTGEISRELGLPLNTVLSHLRRFRIVAVSAMQQWMRGSDG